MFCLFDFGLSPSSNPWHRGTPHFDTWFYNPCREPGFCSTVRAGGWGVVWGDPDDYEDWWEGVGLTGDELYMEIHGLSSVGMHPEAYATRLVEAQPLEKYRVWMRFADGTEGTADFGDFAGKGVFRQWEAPGVWEGMRMSHVEVWGSPRKPL